MQKYAKLSIYKVILLVVVKFSLSQLKSDCNVGVQPTNMFLSCTNDQTEGFDRRILPSQTVTCLQGNYDPQHRQIISEMCDGNRTKRLQKIRPFQPAKSSDTDIVGPKSAQVLRRLHGPLSLDELDEKGEVHAPWPETRSSRGHGQSPKWWFNGD